MRFDSIVPTPTNNPSSSGPNPPLPPAKVDNTQAKTTIVSIATIQSTPSDLKNRIPNFQVPSPLASLVSQELIKSLTSPETK